MGGAPGQIELRGGSAEPENRWVRESNVAPAHPTATDLRSIIIKINKRHDTMTIEKDIKKGKQLAKYIHDSFATHGILGHKAMPEDILPEGIDKGSLEHLMFITLTVSIDYQRDAMALWENSRKTFEDIETRYLFDPKSVCESSINKIVKDMEKHNLSKKPKKDAEIWRRNATSFHKKWGGDPRNFLKDCGYDSLTILIHLKHDFYVSNGKLIRCYKYLGGDKIGPLWVKMLRDNFGMANLKNLEKVPIPVDIHVARATLATGIVKGKFEGNLANLFKSVRDAWFESVHDLRIDGRAMIAIDMDEPLWHLSKDGCTNRDKTTKNCPKYEMCDVKKFCIDGGINLNNNHVELDT
ncbi:MAG: hypothetical protein KAR76_05370 [Methanosarcinales archaeon]|nr:hypothetical protein [Methanosarcinales archaeon]